MVSPETTPPPPPATASPRISFSGDFLDDANFICITPQDKEKEIKTRTGEFEFLSGDLSSPATMLTADELFFEGKLLPFWQNEKLNKISIKPEKVVAKEAVTMKEDENNNNNNRMSWFIDEDPSPRPPKCTVLWKELLRLKKQRASSVLSPSSSTSSNSSSNSIDDQDSSKKEKQQQVKRIKKGLERTRSSGIKIRPMINLPICSQGGRTNSLPPLFSLRKGM
ncbi:uncharacterized protein LOC112516229 [Cynara cardunculus var. scolymus]|uniref:Uncharacterized protein n=1 Tax=Cynara cardunculus var. scolymus TaxID=59895 RepID=A0A124SCE8_CYNCS|nr:uncharacterized protein LOC112516229 [Cynara cardunculus var. scolymus]KVH93580.1 hypothetical protein Ccrd_004368 [Cynara cardunculus var. scolymus]